MSVLSTSEGILRAGESGSLIRLLSAETAGRGGFVFSPDPEALFNCHWNVIMSLTWIIAIGVVLGIAAVFSLASRW